MKAGQASDDGAAAPLISSSAVLGNIFLFAFAGRQTTANNLTYAVTLLAYHQKFQRALQANLDAVLGDRSVSEWSYRTDFPTLLNSYTGAVLNETLRIYGVLPFLPLTTDDQPRTLKIRGETVTVPPNTICIIDTSATHRDPKHWPKAPPNATDDFPHPVSSFNPDQWLKSDENGNQVMITPLAGSYVPFAEGSRNCLGKRFAQTEICALLAVIFKFYDVDLDVEGKGDAEDHAKARRHAEFELSSGLGFTSSLKMMGIVPLRFTRRSK